MLGSIVLFGDSVLARMYQDNAMALIPRLTAAFPMQAIQSFARSGTNSIQTLGVVKSVPLPSNASIIICIGMNDAAPWKQVALEDFRSAYSNILDICVGHPVILITPYPVSTAKQLPPGRDNAQLDKYKTIVMNLARTYNMVAINLYELINVAMQHADMHVEDGVHLNEAGYELLFAHLLPVLQNHGTIK